MKLQNTILIVDDDEGAQETLGDLLMDEGYNLTFASNGTEALQKARKIIPDLILLDVMMPDISGYEVCRQLRTDPVLEKVPVIMVTALSDPASRLKGLNSGAEDFLTKPINSVELRVRVRTIMKLNRYRRLFVEREKFDRIVELLPDGLVIVDKSGIILHVNPAFSDLISQDSIGVLVGAEASDFSVLGIFGFEDEQWQILIRGQAQVERSETQLRNDSGHFIPVEVVAGHINWEDKPAILIVIRDIKVRKQAEEKLRSSLLEKDFLLKEIHHRVKNNLQIIASLLRIQSRQAQDGRTHEMFQESLNRIQSMALVHETLYRSYIISQVDFTQYFRRLVQGLCQTYGVNFNTIDLDIFVENTSIKIKYAVPLGLIVNELVSNALKHGFPAGSDQHKKIEIMLHQQANRETLLVVRDNGIGISPTVDLQQIMTMGLQLVVNLAERQLDGSIQINRDKGTEFHISFKV